MKLEMRTAVTPNLYMTPTTLGYVVVRDTEVDAGCKYIEIYAGEIDAVIEALQECKKLMEQTKMDPEATKMLSFLRDARAVLQALANAGELVEQWGDRETAVNAKRSAMGYLDSLREFLAKYD